MTGSRFRVYFDESEIGKDGYPLDWHHGKPAVKDLVRELTDHRCERCGHPYRKGEHGRGEWTPCDDQCTHAGPMRWNHETEREEAQWRILTVHHLNGVKHDLRWWNLAALCQRCHLTIQGRVVMNRVYQMEHSEWFKPHAAGWYAFSYLGQELSYEETMSRLDELLALEMA